jgi:hypothetical protein
MSALQRWQVYWGFRQSTPSQIFKTPAELFAFHIQQGCFALHASLQEFFNAVIVPEWLETQCWVQALLNDDSAFRSFHSSNGLSISEPQLRSVLRLISVHDKVDQSRWTLLEQGVLLCLSQERAYGDSAQTPKAFRELVSVLIQLHTIESHQQNPMISLALTDTKLGLQLLDYFYFNACELHPVWFELKQARPAESLAA